MDVWHASDFHFHHLKSVGHVEAHKTAAFRWDLLKCLLVLCFTAYGKSTLGTHHLPFTHFFY